MKTIVIANRKGGVGKTTTVLCVAGILQARGKKVLVIDTDVQCNCSDVYRAKIEDTCTLYDVLLSKEPCTIEEAIQHTEAGDIIASDPLLSEADAALSNTASAYFRLQEALNGLKGYDYVLIDTNPGVNTMFYNALVAADSVIIPIMASRFATSGLAQLINSIEEIRKYMNPKLSIDGLLLVMFNERTNLNKDTKVVFTDLSKQVGVKLFKTYIRECTKCKEAQMLRVPLISYAPKCTTEEDYEAFVQEWIGGRKRNG